MNIVKVNFGRNVFPYKYMIAPQAESNIVEFDLYTSVNSDYFKEVSDIKQIMKDYKDYNNRYANYQENSEKNKIIEHAFENNYNLYEYFDYIMFEDSYDTVLKYLRCNPKLKNKKIILDNVNFIEDDIKTIINEFKSYDIYVRTSHGDDFCSLKKYQQAYNILDECILSIKEIIKRYNLSPIEQLMLTYDIVRGRVYTEEEKNDSLTASRDLTNVLSGDKIVCTGYANLFDEIIWQLGLKGAVYNLYSDSEVSDHSRNIVYVNDNKYKINGLYFFDTTWDSAKCKEDLSYLESYNFFAKTKSQMDKYYRFDSEDCMSLAPDFGEKFASSLSKMELCDSNMIKTVNIISKIIDDKILIKLGTTIDKNLYEKIDEYSKLSDNPINGNTFIKILIEVRKAERSISNKYLSDSGTLSHIIVNSDLYTISKLNELGKGEKTKQLKKC